MTVSTQTFSFLPSALYFCRNGDECNSERVLKAVLPIRWSTETPKKIRNFDKCINVRLDFVVFVAVNRLLTDSKRICQTLLANAHLISEHF